MNEENCDMCGCPVHPCLPCEEVVALCGNKTDMEYCNLLRDILRNGKRKKNRTGVDTIGVFGRMAKFDVNMNAFPILTTKKVWFKGIVHELLWFIKGDTNIKYLVDNDVHIWDEWAYKRYVEWYKDQQRHFAKEGVFREPWTQEQYIEQVKLGNVDKDLSELGEGTYGGMWRAFPYHDIYDYEGGPGHVDQLQKVIDKLKTNPDDRRMIVSAWHPYWVDHCALPPCHCLFHFNTEELTNEERDALATDPQKCEAGVIAMDAYDKEGTYFDTLSALGVPKRKVNLLMYQRSLDLPIGGPFNITSYSLLLAMIAHCVGMVPGTFTWSTGDTHIYVNQLDGVKEQLTRTPKQLPRLVFRPTQSDLFKFEYKDIVLVDYDPHPAIKMPVAV